MRSNADVMMPRGAMRVMETVGANGEVGYAELSFE